MQESHKTCRNLAGFPTWTPLIARSPTCSEGDFLETMLQELITSTGVSTGRRSGNYPKLNLAKICYHRCPITFYFDKGRSIYYVRREGEGGGDPKANAVREVA